LAVTAAEKEKYRSKGSVAMEKETYEVPELTALGDFTEETGRGGEPNWQEVVIPWDYWV
jgi:hypothetical protein